MIIPMNKFVSIQEADYAPCGIVPLYEHNHKVDYSIPWTIDSLKIVTPFPAEEDQHFTGYIIRPFQSMVFTTFYVNNR